MQKMELDNGNIQLYLGDMLTILPTLKLDRPALVFADLPYGSTNIQWDTVIHPISFWTAIKSIPYTRILIMTGGKPHYLSTNIEEFKYKLYWNKKFGANFTQVKRQPFFIIEEIEVYGVGVYNPQMRLRKVPIVSGKRANARVNSNTDVVTTFIAPKKTYTHKYPENLITIPRPIGRLKNHPTEKPLELLEYLIRTYSNPGDLIIDPTMGSGTTGVAAINTSRRFIGIEKEEKYFLAAVDRCKQALEKKQNENPPTEQTSTQTE